jgi:5-(carboxyamino)imidazole ribonucleotide synthase
VSLESPAAATFAPLSPTSTIGILGGGQLGRMLALAAARLGFDVCILTPEEDAPASRVAASSLVAAYDDPVALAEFAARCSVATFEFENVPARVVDRLAATGLRMAPGPLALATAQDRVAEKTFFRSVGVGCADFAPIDRLEDLEPALARIGTPALLKTRREGYDGKGQAWIRTPDDAAAAHAAIGGAPAILEGRVAFVRELSVIAARSWSGDIAAYPLAENTHENGVLRRTVAPARVGDETAAAALEIASRLLRGLDYVGVMGVELFELADGRLLVNEIAPRVHNTGHWTLDACEVDQFEQHIRAVAGWPLGPTRPFASAEMINLLGSEADAWLQYAADPAARLWLYGKAEAKPGRKMGHVNRLTGPLDRTA